MTTSLFKTLPLAIAVFGLTACGGGDEPDAPPPPPEPAAETPAPAATPEEEPNVSFAGPAFELTMTPVGNEMQFEQTEFTVAPGQEVKITFNNTADNPAMSHNVVFVQSEGVINAVGQAAMSAAATDYIPEGRAADIIAYTPMAAPGETVEVTFTAPSTEGDYPFVCTFPGHYMTMQGIMRVAG